MASDDSQLQFIIKAVDEASAALAQVKAATDAMKTSTDAASAAMDKNSSSASKAQKGNESLSAAVFKGVASWDLLKQAAEKATQFMEQSVDAFIDAQKKVDLTKSTIIAMGQSLTDVLPTITAYGESMGVLGVDNEQASLSAAQLAKAAGNDVPKGLQLATLASDLASSGYGNLADNTNTLIGILNGKGTAAIKQWHLAVSDTATTADILNAAQSKVTETTAEYANTIPGQIGVVKNAYEQLQQSIGGGLVGALSQAMKQSGLMSATMSKQNEIMQYGAAVGYELGQMLIGIAESLIVVGKTIAVAIEGFDGLWKALHGDLAGAMAEAQSGVDDLGGSIGNLLDTVKNIINPTQGLADVQKTLANSFQNTSGAVAAVGDGVANMSSKANASFVKLADKLAALKDAYKGLTEGAATDLATLADDHNKAMTSITLSIAKTQQAMGDLTRAYSQQAGSDESSVADQIVASQNKVADLKKQLAAATTQDLHDQLQTQLDAEQKNLTSSQGFIDGHQGAIAAAQQRASETDLQRTIDDYNTKRTLATQAYNEQLTNLQNELAAEQAQQTAEVSLYTQRVAQINTILKAANADYVTLSNDRLAQTTDEVNKEIALFQSLAQAISASKAASAGALATISVPSLPHKAGGGSVVAGQSYIVGEKGQEVFTPGVSGNITPHGQSSGGGQTITINIQGAIFSKDAAATLSDIIMKQLRMKTRVSA